MSEKRQIFYKYHGCGNDFIIIDHIHAATNSDALNWLSEQKIRELCALHTGVGADGLLLLLPSQKHMFQMEYYNADGRLGSLCGNGSRCAVQYAHDRGMSPDGHGIFRFEASDGVHTASMQGNRVSVSLLNFTIPEPKLHGWFVHNGSPHFLIQVNDTHEVDVELEGRRWRHHADFGVDGTNVNFIEVMEQDRLKIRTFERGVERETLACGTGVTAAAAWYAACFNQQNGAAARHRINIEALGGELIVEFAIENHIINTVQLIGPATFVFEGTLVF